MRLKTLLAWSGGKDSVMALYELKQSHDCEISALLTTVTEDYDRISMHGVRCKLLEQQAKAVELPLEKIYISKNASNDEYEARMKERLMDYKSRGVSYVAFGDIFLQDVRKYREQNLSKIEMHGLFPLWGKHSTDLARRFIHMGFKAVITCVDSNVIDKRLVGRMYDEQFLKELPANVDPCGENGEFHSFVYDGPIFKTNIEFTTGEVVLCDNRFCFIDLVPL